MGFCQIELSVPLLPDPPLEVGVLTQHDLQPVRWCQREAAVILRRGPYGTGRTSLGRCAWRLQIIWRPLPTPANAPRLMARVAVVICLVAEQAEVVRMMKSRLHRRCSETTAARTVSRT